MKTFFRGGGGWGPGKNSKEYHYFSTNLPGRSLDEGFSPGLGVFAGSALAGEGEGRGVFLGYPRGKSQKRGVWYGNRVASTGVRRGFFGIKYWGR